MMNSSFLSIFSIVSIAVQWVGVLVMRGERAAAWCIMLVGTVIATSGPVLSLIALVHMFAHQLAAPVWPGLGYRGTLNVWMLGLLGNLLFVGGFTLYGLKRRVIREREQQLEAMTAAMAEELRVLRERAD